jgi:hypothetical protein
MSQTGRWLAVAVIAITCLLVASAAWAQSFPDTYSVNYFSNNRGGGLDQTVRIINPGTYAPSFPPASMCAMIYVFDNKQELKECCGCLISYNGLAELSVYSDLTGNVYATGRPADGAIKLISAIPNASAAGNPVCDPAGGGFTSTGTYALTVAPTPNLRAWGTHLPGSGVADGNTTEDEFQDATLSNGELDSLQEECAGILNNGSGYGYCGLAVSNSSFSCGPNFRD